MGSIRVKDTKVFKYLQRLAGRPGLLADARETIGGTRGASSAT
jgi:hypothetical protein